MPAATLNCPSCGASLHPDATSCPYCNTRLATIACPSCFGLAFLGSRFCPHCGHPLSPVSTFTPTTFPCPRCRIPLQNFELGLERIKLRDCPQCCGIWVDTPSFQQICADREDQAAILGAPTPVPLDNASPKRSNVPCPQCANQMTLIQFSRRSGIVIDICRAHGVWFDRDELRHIIEFIRSGGLDRARQLDKQELDQARRELDARTRESPHDEHLASIASAAGLLGTLLD